LGTADSRLPLVIFNCTHCCQPSRSGSPPLRRPSRALSSHHHYGIYVELSPPVDLFMWKLG